MNLNVPVSFDPRRAAIATKGSSYMTRSVGSNATSFQSGNTANFKIGGNMPTTWCDFSSSFLRLKCVNKSDTLNATLGACGCLGLISKIHLSQAGSVLSECSDFAKLATIDIVKSAGDDWLTGLGNTMCGTNSLQHGLSVDAGNSKTFCIPLSFFPGLFQTAKNIPMGGMDLDLKITFGNYNYGVAWSASGASNSDLMFEDLELCLQHIQLSDVDTATINKLAPFSVLCKGVAEITNSIPEKQSNYTVPIGAQYSNVLGMDFVQTASSLDADTNHLHSEFITNDLKSHTLLVGGVGLENSRGVRVDEASEIAAFQAISGGYLSKTSGVPRTNHTDILASDRAGAVFSQSIEVYKGGCSNFGVDIDEKLNVCSGRSTLNSSVVLQLQYGGTNEPATFTGFIKYGMLIVYDDVHKVFRVSV